MAETLRFGARSYSGTVGYRSQFATLADFWWEGSPDVTVADGVLRVRTTFARDAAKHFVSTVFCRRPFAGNLLVEFDARSNHPESHRNFNLFLHTALADGRDLYATRGERTGEYAEYHAMLNYLFTFLPGRIADDGPQGPEYARWRFRRDPGFRLMKEVYSTPIVEGRWYRFQYLLCDGVVGCSVDRDPLESYAWRDPAPLTGGHLGFRTFCSHMEYRDLTVWEGVRET
ncbi:MAG: DUF1961 family protein [Planctomycetota bacterium]